MKKRFEDKKLFEEIMEDEMDDCNCLMCQVTKYNMRFGRYPNLTELTEFLKNERWKC